MENVARPKEESVVSMMTTRMIETIEQIGNDLLNAPAEVRTMDEHRFVSLFVPLFAGEDTSMYPELSLNTWLNFTGSPFKEVSIVDKSGEELYRVPPVFSPNALKPLDGSNGREVGSVTWVMDRANLIAKQGINSMWAFIHNEFAKRDMLFDKKRDDTNYNARWVAILARYGRKAPALPESFNQSSDEALPNAIDSTSFDEF